jgi:hypothetical protein
MKISLVLVHLFMASTAWAGLEPEWGVAQGGLQLGIAQGSIDRTKKVFEVYFALKNISSKPITIVEKMSCSGPDLTLELKLNNKRERLHPPEWSEVCTINVPILRTIAPNALAVMKIRFAFPSDLIRTGASAIGRIQIAFKNAKQQKVELVSKPLPLRP